MRDGEVRRGVLPVAGSEAVVGDSIMGHDRWADCVECAEVGMIKSCCYRCTTGATAGVNLITIRQLISPRRPRQTMAELMTAADMTCGPRANNVR